MSDLIYVDHSTLSTFATCKEKGRLAYVEHLSPVGEAPPLVFGSAFHAAIAEYYTSDDEGAAVRAFLSECKESPDALPLSADSDERRSIERGVALIRAYIKKWRTSDINWSNMYNPDTGEPYVEIGFAVYFMDWKDVPVLYVGKIDRIRRNRVDGGIYNWETKTTSSNVSHYVNQIRPNHQITGYKWAARELLGMEITGTIFDVTHVSDRKIGGKFPDGIDSEKDFARVETRRSATDIEEFLYDLRMVTTDYLTLRDSGARRWARNAPAACYMYGGCHFRDVCASNGNPSVIDSKFKVRKWEPWKITGERIVTNSPAGTPHLQPTAAKEEI